VFYALRQKKQNKFKSSSIIDYRFVSTFGTRRSGTAVTHTRIQLSKKCLGKPLTAAFRFAPSEGATVSRAQSRARAKGKSVVKRVKQIAPLARRRRMLAEGSAKEATI
uniref:60S ribosomal protein L28 n=1 Tax=Anopheles atroparvus TaxID=41427 RepID=A0AAG5DIQ2_ANOAO